MSIREDLVTQDDQARIRIGQVVKRSMNGAFGEIFRALKNGLITEELTYNQTDNTMSADRHLGRCEAYTNMEVKLEQMIAEMEDLTKVVSA